MEKYMGSQRITKMQIELPIPWTTFPFYFIFSLNIAIKMRYPCSLKKIDSVLFKCVGK